jgi:death-on-curing protein
VIDDFIYLSYAEAVSIHIRLMQFVGEIRFGVFDRNLVESALARPKQAASYEDADIIRQAVTLCFGLIKDHPWVGGNKRTATAITIAFLRRNGKKLLASKSEIIELVLAIGADRWQMDEIEAWFRQHTKDKE